MPIPIDRDENTNASESWTGLRSIRVPDVSGFDHGPRTRVRSMWIARQTLLDTAETLARTVLAAHGAVTAQHLVGWCEKIGVVLNWVHGPEEGHYVRERGTASINIRPGGSDVRRNFTMAHELGHHFVEQGRSDAVFRRYLDTPALRTLASIEVGAETEEILCNLFAVSLLLPAKHVRGLVGERPITLNDVRRMARIFGVSPSSFTNRLNDLQVTDAAYARCHVRGDHYVIAWMTGGPKPCKGPTRLRLATHFSSTPREGLLCTDEVHAVEVDMDERPDGYCVALIRPQRHGAWRTGKPL